MSGGGARQGCGAIDISLAKVFGFVGALSFVVEGILLPVTPAAHVILFASYLWAMRRFCIERRRHLALWVATAIAASAATLYATGMTPVNLLFRRAPLEALALVALLWGISALPFYAVNDPLYKATGDYKFRLAWISYAAGATLFVANVGFIALAYAFLVLALAFLNLK